MTGLCLHPVWISLGRSSVTSSQGSSAPLSTSSTPATQSLPLPPSNPWGWPMVRSPWSPFPLPLTSCLNLCLLAAQLPPSSAGPHHESPGCAGPRGRLPETVLSLHCLLSPEGWRGCRPQPGLLGRWCQRDVWPAGGVTAIWLPQALITISCAMLCCRGRSSALRTSPHGRSSCPAVPR